MKNKINYFPYTPVFILALLSIIVFLVLLVQIGIITYAYEKVGIDSRYVLLILVLSILGSYLNIPVAVLDTETAAIRQKVKFFGVRYIIPEFRTHRKTVLAINTGGALIPVALSLYLLFKNGIFVQSLLGAFIISTTVYYISRPVHGVGIAVPVLIPPVAAAITSLIIPTHSPPALAYISGTMGTLIGADIMNLDKIKKMGAPVVSIGGAGTFDGIFITGILAVLLA